MIRAFIAVEITPATIERVTVLIDQLIPRLAGVRWIGPNNFHLTLKFLGNIDESQIEPIGAALTETLRPFPRMTINVKGLGVFPNPRRPRVLWVGLVGSRLALLQSKVESALTPLGFAPDEKMFTPHLTIGRWHQGAQAERNLDSEVAKWCDHEFGVTSAEEVILFRSEIKPTGATYHRLKVVTLNSDRMP